MKVDWLQLKRMVGINAATPEIAQEGQVRYVRDGDVSGALYLARHLAGHTYEWETLNAKQPLDADLTSFASSLLANYLVFRIARDNTNATNTDTANDVDAVSTTITLPAGTWTLVAAGGATAFHSSTGGITCSISLNADVGAASTIAAGPTAGDRFAVTAVHLLASVAGSSTPTCKVVFHSVTAGTSTVDTSWLFIVGIRTA